MLEPGPPAARRVGWGFISLYALAYMSTSLLFIAPLLVTLALKVNSLVGIEEAPDSLALVASVGALVAMVGNPVFGKLSDRTAARAGMRRPWMVIGLVGGSTGILVVALHRAVCGRRAVRPHRGRRHSAGAASSVTAPCRCRMAIGIRPRVPGCAKTARPWWDLTVSAVAGGQTAAS